MPPQEPHPPDVVHAFKWSILGEAVSRLVAPAIFLVLARLLTPEDFGIVAAAMVVISFGQAIADAGLGKTLVQRRDALEASADVAFWLALAVSLLLGTVLVVVAPRIASFFDDARIASVVRILALQVPLAGLAAVPIALLQRNLAFRELFWVRLLTSGLPALASIPMALAGAGYWALVAGAVAGQALQCIVLWWRSHWRPRPRVDTITARELMRFGRWTALSAVFAWCYGWLDALFVARYLGPHDMGLYRIGNTFVTIVFGLAFAPLLPVLYSLFSRSGHRTERVGAALMATARTIVLLSLPAAALLALFSASIQEHVFGPKWVGLAPVLALLAIGQGVAWLVGVNGEAYRAIGRPDIEVLAMGLGLLAYIAGYALAIRFGLVVFVAARAGLVLVGLALHVYVANRLFELRTRDWIAASVNPATFVLISSLVALGIRIAVAPGIAGEIAVLFAFLLTYALLVLAFDRRHFRRLRRLLSGSTTGPASLEQTETPFHG